MRKLCLAGIALIASVAAAGSANATLLELDFSGETAVTPAGAAATFSGSILFETGTANFHSGSTANSDLQYYHNIVSMTVTSGSFTNTIIPTSLDQGQLQMEDSYNGNAQDHVAFEIFLPSGGYQILSLYGPFSAITSSDIPTSMNIAGFTDIAAFNVHEESGVELTGHVTSLSISPYLPAVPEPATWALFLGGFGLVGAAMRRRPSVAVRFA